MQLIVITRYFSDWDEDITFITLRNSSSSTLAQSTDKNNIS